MPGLALGYIHGGTVHEGFMRSVIQFLAHDGRERQLVHALLQHGGPYLDTNRNEVVKEFLATDAQWLLFVDTDILFDADVPYRLLDAANDQGCQIVSALYFGYVQDQDLSPVWFGRNERDEFTVLQSFRSGMQKLAAVGMGCCLIHRQVFERFRFRFQDNKHQWFARDEGRMDGRPAVLGEDLCFCARASALDIKIWGHGGIVVEHLKAQRIGLPQFLATGTVKIVGER